MNFALATIWYERQRYIPAICAVAFSAVLIVVQTGLMLGLAQMMSLPVDQARADLWVGYPGVRSVDLGRSIPESSLNLVAAHPDVERVEPCVLGFSIWTRLGSLNERPPNPEVITVVGTRLDHDSLGTVDYLREHPELLAQLNEPGTVVVDAGELDRLGISGIGDQAEVFGHRVRVVGIVHGYQAIGGPYVFCSVETASQILRAPTGTIVYVLAKLRKPEHATEVGQRLSEHRYISAYPASDFSFRTRQYWLTRTKAGVAVGFTALLSLLVGGVVTSQTLYSATAASHREFATLRAMGIPSWRLKFTVLEQAFWVGLAGIIISMPFTVLLAHVAGRIGTAVVLHPLAIVAGMFVTMSMALGAGLAALRSFQGVDPAMNIR